MEQEEELVSPNEQSVAAMAARGGLKGHAVALHSFI